MSLDEKLAKIRSPNLQSQQHTAVVLSSIEETLRAQNGKFSPVAYFAALLAVLKQQNLSANLDNENNTVTSSLYLLDLITSHVPAPLLKTQFETIVKLLAPLLKTSNSNALSVKSAVGCLESVLIAQDGAAWQLSAAQVSPRQAVQALLSLALDPRPKLRKRAREALTTILRNPPPGPAIDHPAADLCAAVVQNDLKNSVDNVHQARRQKGNISDDINDSYIIHALQLCKIIAVASGGWPSKNIETLCELLLSISRSRNDFLVVSAFEVFEVILESMKDEVSSAKLPKLLESIVELKPAQNDSQLIPSWIAVLSRGYGVASEIEPEETFWKLPDLLDLVSNFLLSPSENIQISASECLISFYATCVPRTVISEPSIYDEKVLQKIADHALSLLTVKYQPAWRSVFASLTALFDAIRWRGDPFLLPLVQSIGNLRTSEGYHGRQEADDVLGHAIRNLGPEPVLRILPHYLNSPKNNQPGRAWLLPILRDYVSNTNLAHFKSDLVPLSETMYQRVLNHGSTEKTMDIKIFETVVQQIWAIFPGYCDLPLDLAISVDQSFAELISNLLYKQSELRHDLCRGLQNLVESNQALLNSDLQDELLQFERRMGRMQAEANIQHLAKLASNLLAVLFNVYSQTLPQFRAYLLQCINSYLSITPEKDLVETFERVSKMLESELPSGDIPISKKEYYQSSNGKLPPTSHTLMDLIIALSIYLPRTSFGALFSLASNVLSNAAILKSDPQLIKKVYKLLPRLATSPTGAEALKARNKELQNLILNTADKTPVAARRDRLLSLNVIISSLSVEELHFIPSILSEVVLACKDNNEKARNAGFDVLVASANKIADPSNPSGTVIHNSKVPHMAENSPDASATMEEVFTMVSAGLAGVAPHMVAASITALSRLFFEFHDQLSGQVREDIVDTVNIFLESNNREIVRSVLGFVKVIVVVLPLRSLEPRMPNIVKGLMVWSRENKGRLRSKVKGILDRSIRRFGGSKLEEWVGFEDRRMIVNIRKRRERSKRKKKEGAEGVSSDEEGEKTYDNEFDEAVYGSDDDDSDIENESDDDMPSSKISFRKESQTHQKPQYIRQNDEDDEPLDLLDPRSMANIASRKPENTKNTKQKKKDVKFNEDGKLVFGSDEDSDDGNDKDVTMSDRKDGSHNAYLDAVQGPDAVKRGQRGRLKMKSGFQKQRRGGDTERDGNGDEMEIDVKDAKEVGRKIGNSSRRGRGGHTRGNGRIMKKGRDQKQSRRGLGVEKSRSKSSQNSNFKGKSQGATGVNMTKIGKRNVRFGAKLREVSR